MNRLPFIMPDFSRQAWVSDEARSVWQPRVQQIARSWQDIEWLSVVYGIRRCALVGLSPATLTATVPRWQEHGLSALAMPMHSEVERSHPAVTFAVVGNLEDVAVAHQAWIARDDETLGLLFGYPACCRAFFHRTWAGQQLIDTTWAMAANTTTADGGTVTVRAPGAHWANVMWRWVGVRAVSHLPCRFDCTASLDLGDQLLDVGVHAGYREEAGWIREILSWPAEWSALHGIAEVKTPILKFSTRTDATASTYVVKWMGTAYPPEGAFGLRFPYRTDAQQAGHASLPPRQEDHRETVGFGEPWYWADNGFSSLQAMDELHRPIVALARQTLQQRMGHVLDLGCGNGALLAQLCRGRSDLMPCGVDSNRASLEHARLVLANLPADLTQANIFDSDRWGVGTRYAISLLMIGRLLEVERPQALRLLARLQAASDAILVYSYPRPDDQSLASMAQRLGLALANRGSETADLLAGS